jgi:hypothetical protein
MNSCLKSSPPRGCFRGHSGLNQTKKILDRNTDIYILSDVFAQVLKCVTYNVTSFDNFPDILLLFFSQRCF